MIRTLVSAETDFARAGLASIVSNDARLILVGESAPGDLAAMIARSSPDVILEDRGDEPESTRVPRVALVDDPRAAWIGRQLEGESADSGAILARDASSDQIVAAIVAVAAGLVALAPRAIFAREPLAEAVSAANERATGTERLTQRERDILGEVARGAPNKIIAARLGISEHTVKFHIGSIFAKLDVTSRTEAVTRGIRLGLVML